jgi:hypothetical protein
MKDYFDRFKFKPVVVEDLLPYVLELESGSEEKGQWDAFLASLEQQTVGYTVLLEIATHDLGFLPTVE